MIGEATRFNRKSIAVTASDDSRAVTVADMRVFLRETSTDFDLQISAHIDAATEAVKEYTRRGILTETFKFTMDGFRYQDADDRIVGLGAGVHDMSVPYALGGADFVDLPFVPLQSVTSVTTYDRANAATVFASSSYQVDLNGGRIYLNEGETWPTDLRAAAAVEIVYVAGYGSANVPEPIRQAIRTYVQGLYDGCSGMSDEVKRMLAPYRRLDQLPW